MPSVVSNSPMVGSPSPQRPARKTPSFLSLHREKDRIAPSLDISSSLGASGPSLKTQSYFDVYPRPKTSPHPRQSRFKLRDGRQVSSGQSELFSRQVPPSEAHRTTTDSKGVASSKESYAFPTSNTPEDEIDEGTELTPRSYSRTRSRTGPSSASSIRTNTAAFVPSLRFSGSSSTQHTETPPFTPVDSASYTGSFEEVVVAAPVSGVETMDALVDGMNGGDHTFGGSSISHRAKFGIPGHHPLYQPPLPIPPPGVVLGGGKVRRPSKKPSHSSDEEDMPPRSIPTSRPRRKRNQHGPGSRTASNSTITLSAPPTTNPSEDEDSPLSNPNNSRFPLSAPSDGPKNIVPSISEIIRAHAPPECQTRTRFAPSRVSSVSSHSHPTQTTVHEEPDSELEPLTADEEGEIVSRSSIDSIANEVRQTIRNQRFMKPAPVLALQRSKTSYKRYSTVSDSFSLSSPPSEATTTSSIYSSSAASSQHPGAPFDAPTFLSMPLPTPSQAVAQYLRSARLTTLLKLTRSPHASQDKPLTISLSDLGSPTGIPVVVFLGLGCVRHIMGLYDEMAECLGLRLITIDRWGLGRTDQRPKSAKGIMQWAGVVEEVLDLLHVEKCSVIAHSAGAPYALSFANRFADRIQGDICLLAPWVGGTENGGYKWLKYVPNGILKTAQAAEWKLQAWMIGKPPSITYEGIGYTPEPSRPSTSTRPKVPTRMVTLPNVVYLSNDNRSRPSVGSNSFSEYDDLGDFEGRFGSRSTLGTQNGGEQKTVTGRRKTSRSFLNKLKGHSSGSQSQSPTEEKSQLGKKLKSLRSVGSLKGKTSPQPGSRKSEPSTPQVPPLQPDVGLGLERIDWLRNTSESSPISKQSTSERFSTNSCGPPYVRSTGRRSISFTSSMAPTSLPSSPAPSTFSSPYIIGSGTSTTYQATLGNALIAASHSESAKGTHSDLLQILNHENASWGFSYTSYPHQVRVWYGDKDEKIAENAVRWMERNMGDRCVVKVVKGADHGLMYKSGVVVEVLERIRGYW